MARKPGRSFLEFGEQHQPATASPDMAIGRKLVRILQGDRDGKAECRNQFGGSRHSSGAGLGAWTVSSSLREVRRSFSVS